MRLLAAAQLGDDTETARAFAAVVRQRSQDPVCTALHLTAAMQAVSGVRLAAGGGLGDAWLRIRPWLPPGTKHIELHNVTAQQHRLTVVLQRHKVNSGLHVEVHIRDDSTDEQPLVVSNRWQQFVTAIRSKHPFRCELPARKSEQSPRD